MNELLDTIKVYTSAEKSWPMYELIEVYCAQWGILSILYINVFWEKKAAFLVTFMVNVFSGDVAVKILKVVDPTPEQFQAFRNEVAVLRWVGSFVAKFCYPRAPHLAAPPPLSRLAQYSVFDRQKKQLSGEKEWKQSI